MSFASVERPKPSISSPTQPNPEAGSSHKNQIDSVSSKTQLQKIAPLPFQPSPASPAPTEPPKTVPQQTPAQPPAQPRPPPPSPQPPQPSPPNPAQPKAAQPSPGPPNSKHGSFGQNFRSKRFLAPKPLTIPAQPSPAFSKIRFQSENLLKTFAQPCPAQPSPPSPAQPSFCRPYGMPLSSFPSHLRRSPNPPIPNHGSNTLSVGQPSIFQNQVFSQKTCSKLSLKTFRSKLIGTQTLNNFYINLKPSNNLVLSFLSGVSGFLLWTSLKRCPLQDIGNYSGFYIEPEALGLAGFRVNGFSYMKKFL